ncbi:AbrB/MazE/SpoVT family DNA-binding domain-containing protein [Methanobacterium formicicum]|uniref:SpoVT-AbrB domain-containing protein n=1 Tax=Methanobacterium formicicum (strain DSM 3637 / PP1) TaxID=1204725 RepID=K2RVU3_METFP|nr:AbrB/MazE/SpoVT family DNA-binding domain-containing protein [Methanobacterium formicicum]EKF86850.1 hypothetical protein A994_01150 [Methanobacterium formicicum DSM 3637]
MVELDTMKIQKTNGSYFVYIPKVWVNAMDLKKGDKLIWSVEEGNHGILILKKMIEG